jgi:hypothetical protein
MRPYETWNTPMYPGYPKNALEELQNKGYYSYDDSGDIDAFMYLLTTDTMMDKLKGFTEFISEIVDEHFQMTKNVDNNLNYLWFLYKRGTKAGDYKPFILMAEMQLLKEMGYITVEEIDNMWNMLNSEDRDNFNLVYLAMKSLRSMRIKEHGIYTVDNMVYEETAKDYPFKILSQDIFLKLTT